MIKRGIFVFAICLFAMIFLVSAQEIAIDVKIGKQVYSTGENVTYQVVLLKDSVPLDTKVNVIISDVSGKKILNFEIDSNKEYSFPIEKDFLSGYWKIESTYEGKNVKRFFSIGEREEAEFSIDDGSLIIKNTGNIPYTKTVQILIGEKVINQKQFIEVGSFKEIKLVAPDGNYNVQVSDGVTSISKQDVHLTGTGRVIGALDEQLIDNQPLFGSARDVNGDSIFSSRNFSISLIFIGAVFGLFVLILIERVMRKHRASSAKDMLNLH